MTIRTTRQRSAIFRSRGATQVVGERVRNVVKSRSQQSKAHWYPARGGGIVHGGIGVNTSGTPL